MARDIAGQRRARVSCRGNIGPGNAFGYTSAMDLELAPLHPDPKDLGVQDGRRTWGVYTADPAFVARVPDGAPVLRPGWYRAKVRLEPRQGDVHEPRLYIPDVAGHYSEELAVPMLRDGTEYAAEFRLSHPARQIRFDPSDVPCQFACDAMHLTPLSGRALRHLREDAARMLRIDAIGRTLRAIFRRQAARIAPARPADRKERVLRSIDRRGVGLEIGPSHDPIAPKSEGFKVDVMDHATREELLGKYREHAVSLDRIEEVDYVWRGESYLELTGKPNHYDWIIASHVIEHTPDLVAFLRDCDAILKDQGVLSLVIPDKRYVFDRFRPITGLARVIDAHLAGQRIHSAGSVAEYFMNVASRGQQLGWSRNSLGGYSFVHSAAEAREGVRQVLENRAYLDIHNWCFVPHSFRLLVEDLHTLGYTRLREVSFHPTEGCEFYITLGRQGQGPGLSRLQLLRAVDRELAECERS